MHVVLVSKQRDELIQLSKARGVVVFLVVLVVLRLFLFYLVVLWLWTRK